MRFLLIIFLLFSFSKSTFTQNFYWVKNVPGASYVDEEGYTYKTGSFNTASDFDPGLGEYELPVLSDGDGIFALKLDPAGNLIYAHSFNTENNSRGKSIVANEDGETFIWGDYKHSMDADPGEDSYPMPNNGWRDCFLIKLDASGNFLWAKNFGGGWYEFANGIALDSDDNIILTGSFDYSIDCDPGPSEYLLTHLTSHDEVDDFIIKLDEYGNFIWATNIGAPSPPGEYYLSPNFFSLSTDDSNDIYIGGRFGSPVNFNPWAGSITTTVSGEYDGFILKETFEGDFDWVRTILGNSGVSYSEVRSVVSDTLGNLYVCGSFSDSVYLNETTLSSSNGLMDCFILKLNASDGTTVWHKTFGSTENDFATSLCLNIDGTLSITGQFSGTVDFDPGIGIHEITSNGSSDIFIMTINSDGELIWANGLGNANSDLSNYYIGNDGEGKLYISGHINGDVDFDFSAEENYMEGNETFSFSGTNRPFFLKLSPCAISRGDTLLFYLCNDEYLWDETGLTYSETGLYEAKFLSSSSCDSIVYLQLINESLSSGIIQTGATLSSDLSSVNYQWLNCDLGFSQIDGETNQSFDPAANGSYAVIVSNSYCTDTSECFNISNLGVGAEIPPFIRAYPNPNNGTLTIESDVISDIEILMYNSLGSLVPLEVNSNDGYGTVKFDAPPGVYWLKLKWPNNSEKVIRIIKR